jgi:hypothetical protein
MRDLDLQTLRLVVLCKAGQYNVRTKSNPLTHTEKPLP